MDSLRPRLVLFDDKEKKRAELSLDNNLPNLQLLDENAKPLFNKP